MKVLSIAIPSYNSEAYMANCIESLLTGGEDVEILVVDDNQINLMVAEGLISTYGGNVDTADGGKAAIDACKKWEGAIISVGESVEGYHSYEELRETGEIWHPNCRHHITPVSNRVADRITANFH